jgi:HEPN domain-containing protein
MKDITRHWLDFAHADLKNCGKILDDPTLTHIVAFHSLQAVEKSFKALL